jgi:uncharacterized membrane protein (UPF0127 family)
MRLFLPIVACAVLCGCGSHGSDQDTLGTMPVTLPNGRQIRAEPMVNDFDRQRGMMFREQLPEDRGLLFMHDQPSAATYWMYQVKVPLDIVFMDSARRVLGVSANTPPCTTRASECPHYGGYDGTRYVLELRAGEAARNGIQTGSMLTF